MTTQNEVGHWTGLFGKPLSFCQEIKDAIEIKAEWSFDEDAPQRDVVIDSIPGWLPPLWGSDEAWLYLRRPEGIWKVRLPEDKSLGAPSYLYAREGQFRDSRHILGGLALGDQIQSMGGWMRGIQTAAKIDAVDIDEQIRAAAKREGAPADELGGLLDAVVEREPGRMVVDVGGWFDRPPEFLRRGDWLVCADRQTGRSVSFSLQGCEAVEKALDSAQLWLRFGGPWVRPFVVHATLSSTAQ